jgi:hypothetical protein
MKNPLTPAGIEPATFRFVAQHLNHCATAVPTFPWVHFQICFRSHTDFFPVLTVKHFGTRKDAGVWY